MSTRADEALTIPVFARRPANRIFRPAKIEGRSHKVVELHFTVVAWFVKKPRTQRELADLLEHEKTSMASIYIRLLRADGLLYVSGWDGATPTYTWQPSVFFHDDVPRPPPAPRKHSRKEHCK